MSAVENPSAFPVPNDANVNGQEGMTLRDYFAGQALAGLCANKPYMDVLASGIQQAGEGDVDGAFARYMADMATELADAMLAARQEQAA